MAHEVETAAYADTPAWHRIGTVVEGAMSVGEVLKLAQIDWEVALRQTYANLGGTQVKVPDSFAVYRKTDNTILGTVGSKYEPIQNERALNFLDTLVASGDLKFEAAGSLASGRRIWILARIPEEIIIGESRDVTSPFMLLTTSHDGNSALKVIPTAVRAVCANTIQMAWWAADPALTIKVAHIGNIESKIAVARSILNISVDLSKLYGRTMAQLADVDGLPLIDEFLTTMFPPKEVEEGEEAKEDKRRDSTVESFMSLFSREPQSAWGLLNATSALVDHVQLPKNVRGGRFQTKDETQLFSQFEGPGAAFKARATNILLNMADIYERQDAELAELKVRVSTFSQDKAR